MAYPVKQLSVPSLLFNHLYMGVVITLFYIVVSPILIGAGMPGLSALLLAEIAVLAPLVIFHFYRVSKKTGKSFLELIPLRKKMPTRYFIGWVALGVVACFVVYIPLFPLGQGIRESLFSWLPEWYFNPTFGTDNLRLIANVFLAGIIIDGVIGPVAEELFFRGYLLPRVHFLKNWAPIVNGALFGFYHFWQPHNILATVTIGMLLSWIAWKTKNVYICIAIHCIINIIGSAGGFFATSSGIMIGR